MPYYNTCPNCGSNLDPGEVCECRKENKNAELITEESVLKMMDLTSNQSVASKVICKRCGKDISNETLWMKKQKFVCEDCYNLGKKVFMRATL